MEAQKAHSEEGEEKRREMKGKGKDMEERIISAWWGDERRAG